MQHATTLASLPDHEDTLKVIPGVKPGTAIRVCAHHADAGYVRLEHLAYNPGVGWYVQKSFVIPAELLNEVSRELRKADSLMPRRATHDEAAPSLRITPETGFEVPTRPQRRNA